MQKLFTIILGLGIIGYLIYVVILMIQVLAGSAETWSGISGHLIAAAVLLLIMAAGYIWGDKETNEETSTTPVSNLDIETMAEPVFNPVDDQLSMGVYQQQFTTWWYDNDGDKQEQGTIYANLRFYEDGIVIGVRDKNIPKLEFKDSFTMKGIYQLEENRLTFNLDKISDSVESIAYHVTDEDRREMKYYGQIADENSLISQGEFQGKIKGKQLLVNEFTFLKLPVSKLIVTAEEDACEKLEAAIKDHPKVIHTFQNTGNWYSNGETGPEWYTVHVETADEWTEIVEDLVKSKMSELGEVPSNLFWS